MCQDYGVYLSWYWSIPYQSCGRLHPIYFYLGLVLCETIHKIRLLTDANGRINFHKIKLHGEWLVLRACERKNLAKDLIKTKIRVKDKFCIICVCDNKL